MFPVTLAQSAEVTPFDNQPATQSDKIVLAGSHRGGVRPHAPVVAGGHAVGTDVPDDAPWVSGDLGAGDGILFSSRTIHRALPNTTRATLRVSVDYRYRAPRP